VALSPADGWIYINVIRQTTSPNSLCPSSTVNLRKNKANVELDHNMTINTIDVVVSETVQQDGCVTGYFYHLSAYIME
jgi:hypothetical protein